MANGNEIHIPAWVPASIAQCIRVHETYILNKKQRAALIRLATDERMKGVWSTLLTRDRKTGSYRYPGKPRGGWLPSELAQAMAMKQLFIDCYGSIRDQRAETTQEENEKVRSDLSAKMTMLREIARDIRDGNVNNPVKVDGEIEALERVAGWFEQNAQEVRGVDDPLTIKRHRSDAVAGGVLAHCEMAFTEYFGTQFQGLSKTITEVGTGLEVTRDMGGRVKNRKSGS